MYACMPLNVECACMCIGLEEKWQSARRSFIKGLKRKATKLKNEGKKDTADFINTKSKLGRVVTTRKGVPVKTPFYSPAKSDLTAPTRSKSEPLPKSPTKPALLPEPTSTSSCSLSTTSASFSTPSDLLRFS